MKTVLIITTITVLASCSYDLAKNPGPEVAPSATGSELNFEKVYASVIQPVCLECHASPRSAAGLNLESYEAILLNKDLIYRAVASKFMPESQGRSLSDEQRGLLLTWLQQGAPRTTNPSAEPAPSNPLPTPIPPDCSNHREHDSNHDDHCEPTFPQEISL